MQLKLYFSTSVWSVILWIWIGWLGVEMLDSFDGCMFLHLDHYLPERDAFAHRGEDVGIFSLWYGF